MRKVVFLLVASLICVFALLRSRVYIDAVMFSGTVVNSTVVDLEKGKVHLIVVRGDDGQDHTVGRRVVFPELRIGDRVRVRCAGEATVANGIRNLAGADADGCYNCSSYRVMWHELLNLTKE